MLSFEEYEHEKDTAQQNTCREMITVTEHNDYLQYSQ